MSRTSEDKLLGPIQSSKYIKEGQDVAPINFDTNNEDEDIN